MSYCVNCGVELDESMKKCPLCSTPVINPNNQSFSEASPMSDRLEIPSSTSKRFTGFIISMVMLIPNIVFFLCNFLFKFDNKYLMMLNATSVLLWVLLVLPFFRKKGLTLLFLAADAVAVIGYTYVIYRLEKGGGWFLECAVPSIIILAVMIGIFIEWLHHGKGDWTVGAILFFGEIAITSVAIDLILNHYLTGHFGILVSVIISACSVAIIAFFISVSANKKLKAWITRKFFVN